LLSQWHIWFQKHHVKQGSPAKKANPDLNVGFDTSNLELAHVFIPSEQVFPSIFLLLERLERRVLLEHQSGRVF